MVGEKSPQVVRIVGKSDGALWIRAGRAVGNLWSRIPRGRALGYILCVDMWNPARDKQWCNVVNAAAEQRYTHYPQDC